MRSNNFDIMTRFERAGSISILLLLNEKEK